MVADSGGQAGLPKAVACTPAVYTRNGTAYASSRDVAAFFGKRHDNVMRDIKAMIAGAPTTALNCEVSVYVDATGRKLPYFEMTRDGFTLLAMGFTGKTALAFKVRYVEELNRMEALLKAPPAPQLPNFMGPGEASLGFRRAPFRLRSIAAV